MKHCLHCSASIAATRKVCDRPECRTAESAAWWAVRADAHAKRLALRKATRTERVILSRSQRMSVLDRDEWVCHICNLHIDDVAAWPDPESATIDHRVPLALGGSNGFENLAAAHAYCNNVKNDRPISEVA